jgi:hypothetical protein
VNAECCRFDRRQRDFVGPLQECKLGGRFDHTATGGHRIGTDIVKGWRDFPNAVDNKEPNGLFECDASAANATVVQHLDDPLIRALVFLPDANVLCESDGFVVSFSESFGIASSTLFGMLGLPDDWLQRPRQQP